MKYVFGPVPSRRLGRSLGIDPIPFKTCNWNCVYCQLGRTSPPTNERRDYCPPEEIIAEAKSALASHQPGQIDWLTFVGSGEPTLHASLGRMIDELKSVTEIPLAVITNGSLLYLPEVRQDLARADAVMPALDAGNERLYRRIDRPVGDLSLDRLVEGLIAFRGEFPGKLWLEVMLIKGINDSAAAMAELAQTIQRIGPDEVHINLPVRPPAEPWVEPSDEEGLSRAVAILGGIARVVHPANVRIDPGSHENLADAVIAMVKRHPMSEQELLRTLHRWRADQVADVLDKLQASGRVCVVTRHGERFWTSTEARYVEPPSARCHTRN